MIKVDGYHIRALENEVRALGFDPAAEFLPYIADDTTRYRAWRARAALSVVRYMERGGYHNLGYAVRTWALTCQYHGQCGGWAPVGVSDALSWIGETLVAQMRDGAESLGMGAISW